MSSGNPYELWAGSLVPVAAGAQDLFRVSIDMLPDAAVIFARDGTILEVNSAAISQFEADTRGDLIGRNLYSFGTPAPEATTAAIDPIFGGRSVRFEIEVVTLKGRRRILDILDVPLVSPDGEVERVLGFGRDITDQRHAEGARDFMASIIEFSDDAIITVSPELRVLTWNKGAERLLGYTAQEAIGQPVLELYVPARDHSLARSVLEQDLRPDQPAGFVRRLEVPLQRRDRSLIDVSVVESRILDAQGKVVAISSIVRDILEKKRSERENALLAAMVESSDDAITAISTDSLIISWNRGAERLLGFTAEEVLGRNFLDVYVHPGDRPWVENNFREDISAMEREPSTARRIEAPVMRKDGSKVEVSLVASGIFDSSGETIGMSVIMRDLTYLRRIEHEQALLAAIVNASEDAIISINLEGEIVSWNPGAQRLYGYTAEEIVGKTLEVFVPAEHIAQVKRSIQQVISSGHPINYEQRRIKRDGESFDASVMVFPVRDSSSGAITRTAGITRDITYLKAIEEELRQAQQYTRGLIESSIDAMVVVDRDLRITDLNEQFAKLIEVPKRFLVGSRFGSYFVDPAKAAAAVNRTLNEGSLTDCDLVLRTAGGREAQVSFNASIFYIGGKIFGIVGVARDVTEQRAIQRKLGEEREYSRMLVESSPEALLVTDPNQRLCDVNERALELTGYSRRELIGGEIASLFIDAAGAAEAVNRALEKGLVRDVELCLTTRSGGEIPISLSVSAYHDSDGSTRGALVGMRDISEHKLFERERCLLAAIVDSSFDAIYSVDNNLTITSWNRSAERLFAYSAAEVLGRSNAMLVPLDRRAELTQRAVRVRETGHGESFETTRMDKDGNLIDVAVTGSPLLDGSGKLVGLSITAHDISARKGVEAELTRARDAALEAARLKSEFLANMSHEIRTPMNSIIGMTRLLLDTSLGPEQAELARNVSESGEALLTLINEILDFSKIAAGKLVLEELDFELSKLVEGAVEAVAEPARRKKLELTISIDPEAPQHLRGDPGRIRQILLNLLGNAVKFTEHGEVSVQVNKISENPAETILRFEVRDTGIGIPREKQHLLFQPFSQVEVSTSRRFGGTGLGLSIARGLVEKMHGSIALSSTPGEGSTFWFTARLARQVEVSGPAAGKFASLAGVRIIVVDDNANSREILRRQTVGWGMQAEIAPSATAALDAMRVAALDRPFVVAIVDVTMPGVDGIELARIIKSDPKLANTVVIFASSAGPRSEFGARLHGLDFGAWLMKPVSQSTLYDTLIRLLTRGDEVALGSQKSHGDTATEPSSVEAGAVSRLKILVAEDNPVNQNLARLQLQKLGFAADFAQNGIEALEAALRFPYDVILMDCQMPEMDGYEATREIRRRMGSNRRVTIIAVTAHALPGDREKCIAAGMDGYISKPVDIHELEASLALVSASKSEENFPSGSTSKTVQQPSSDEIAAAARKEADRSPGGDAESPPTSGEKTSPGDTCAACAETIAQPREEGAAHAMPGERDGCIREAMNKGATFDSESLLKRLMGDRQLANIIIAAFLEDFPSQLNHLRQRLAEADTLGARMHAHTLKGSAATISAGSLSSIGAEMERLAEAGELDQFGKLLPRAVEEFERLKKTLEHAGWL